MIRKLADYISRSYHAAEYPALSAQAELWQDTVPLKNLHILDATPVFRNTMTKYYALLAAGAKLTVSVGKDIPCDPEIVKILPQFGIRIVDINTQKEHFDLIADCAGRHCSVVSRYGYVELTRSGLEYYRNSPLPVYSADSGLLKVIETSLGTADGFIRAMKKLGYDNLKNKNILIFGGGKVGSGMAMLLRRSGAVVTVAECDNSKQPPSGCRMIHTDNREKVKDAVSGAWCIIAATGLADALKLFADDMIKSQAVIVNMGVEDEFSAAVPEARVLNNKQPLNFILQEPTRLRFIDPVMALNNALLYRLTTQGAKREPGILLPPADLEKEILEKVTSAGLLPHDLINDILHNMKDTNI